MAATRSKVIRLYKNLLKECNKFNTYNYRTYAVRRTKDAFRDYKNETDPSVIQQLITKAESNLEMVKRQVLIGQMYGEGNLVIESIPKTV
ncbi:LYR motif-containing protein 4B-like [Mizuhopecten yessoensis]|uniref:LYR motif-containing protein 4B-like n=1 Tax=Mizuhopecten yessoensis TaxID=6573 RepID=UPI000B45F651|nr:LYR motif-containing protein 4B-like [Mizuhopecten yessoensis]